VRSPKVCANRNESRAKQGVRDVFVVAVCGRKSGCESYPEVEENRGSREATQKRPLDGG